ncbi:MAG: purine-nucleoside phosphorylase [Acholeplasmatales bacterium]|jgi:purine-nucleoside phosphorylase|nr:purine-nucleoside phosphorylase [Acholeplasmatales bacterium]
MPTPHIETSDVNLIAKTVLMPGDPLRAEWISKTYLKNVVKINNVRNMFGYTGYYKNKKVTVMGSGMGMPSIGIYSYELFKFYNVENIIRIGSAGSYCEDLNVYDVVLASAAYSESTFAREIGVTKKHIINSNEELNKLILSAADSLGYKVNLTNVHSSDVFYRGDNSKFDFRKLVKKYGAKCVEMESFALFSNAILLGKKATCLLTISDSLVKKEYTTSEERQSSFNKMVEIALEAAI